ncbi:MAG: TRAP transporter fused permease subunit [Chloroflexi bacterium]|nr:TRAP transporter fused permease subunit [Chloroflexota bacterium]
MAEQSQFTKHVRTAIAIIAVAMAVYHLASTRALLAPSMLHQNIHLGFALLIVFLFAIIETRSKWQRAVWFSFIALSLLAVGYIFVYFDQLQFRSGVPVGADAIIGALLLLVVFVATSKAYGPVFSILAVVLLFYALFGYMIPGAWRTFQFKPDNFIFGISSSMQEGLYGTFLGISANFLFLFVLFGSLMQVSGATRFFEEVSKFLGRRLSGGTALSSVGTSALMGTVTGSVGANIVTTGAFTIPMMKKVGYKPHQAAAIEATASTGGMIMPPIMGAAAFIMASLTGIPYIKIIAMAVLPAIFYFLSVGIYAQLQAMKMKIPPDTERINVREMLLTGPLFIIPLLIIIVLLTFYYTLMYVVFWATVTLIVLSLLRKKTRPTLKQWVDATISGAKMGAQIAVSLATIGVAASIMMHTGLILRLPGIIESWSGGFLPLALIVSSVIAIILGMGLPATAVYVMMALAVVPVLLRMGLGVQQAHLFAFYFGTVSMLTPPVAMGAVIAAKIANANYFKTAIEATKAGLAGFLVPFFMVITPAIILQPQPWIWAVLGIVAILLTLLGFQISIAGQYITKVGASWRWLPALAAVILVAALIMESYPLFFAGIAVFAALTLWQARQRWGSASRGLRATVNDA